MVFMMPGILMSTKYQVNEYDKINQMRPSSETMSSS